MSVTDPIEEAERSASVSMPVLAVAAGAGGTVAVVAAISSYAHLHELALMAGETPGLAKVAPASVDGLVIFGSALIYAQHKARQPVHPLAKGAVVLGVGASLAANVVAKDPTLVPMDWIRWAVAGWPAVALGIVGHLALQLLTLWLGSRPSSAPAEPEAPAAEQVPAAPPGVAFATYDSPAGPPAPAIPAHTGAADDAEPAPAARPAAEPARTQRRHGKATATTAPPEDWERNLWSQLRDARGEPPGAPALRQAAGDAGRDMPSRRASHLAALGKAGGL